VISRRGLGALAAALGGLLLAAYSENLLFLLGAVAIFGFVAGEIALFHLVGPDRGRAPFVATRTELPRVLSPGGTAEVALTVRLNSEVPVRAEVRDLLPGTLERVEGSTHRRAWWTPREERVLRYTLRAGERGSHVVGPVAITVESPHAFAWSQWLLPASAQPVRVVPAAPIERSYRIGPALRTPVQGQLALRHRGFGSEFRSLRPYQSSDDIRHVAWKRSRPGQLYVREFEQESRQDFMLLLDVTPSMWAGLPGETALDRAIEASSLVTSAVAHSGEDRVGFLVQAERLRQYLRPARGELHFRRVAENLAYLKPVEGSFDLASALDHLTRRLAINTHVLAFTALDGPLEKVPTAHARFRARGHHLYLFPANRAGFYPPLPEGAPGRTALRWAEVHETERIQHRIGQLRGHGIPAFPYDRRGATAQVLATYGRLRTWGMA
jgi:uncharacterized protein (DUF58 family)